MMIPGRTQERRARPGDGNDNADGRCEEDTQGGEIGTGKRRGTKDENGNGKANEDGKGKGKGKGKGHGEEKGIVKQTPGGYHISRPVAFQLQKEMSEADLDMEGQLGRVYLEPEPSPAMSTCLCVNTDCTESDSQYDS